MTILSSTPPDERVVELAHAISRLLGWTYFLCWGVSSYPQLFINYSRKSVTGLAFDFFTVNILGFGCYTISSILFLFSPVVRDEYARRHPRSPEPTVRWNDLAFAIHATLFSVVTWSQFFFWGYKRDPTQRLSRTMLALIAVCIATILVSIALALSGIADFEWIDVAYTLQFVKLFISIVKYVPQAWLNYKREATTGWSIHNILLDISGGVLSLAQLVLDSSLQNDWSGLTGNPLKLFLSQISIFFDIIFIIQHYVLYRSSSEPSTYLHLPPEGEAEIGYGTLEPPPRVPRAGGDKRSRSSPLRRSFDEEEQRSFGRFRHSSEGEGAPNKLGLRGREKKDYGVGDKRSDEGEGRGLLSSTFSETFTRVGDTGATGE
ncbi:PQ loop repeat-domain-containing protein [Tuber brumale]|nr:PQ loop repeat-domain-containing protein [Tuber brumale]